MATKNDSWNAALFDSVTSTTTPSRPKTVSRAVCVCRNLESGTPDLSETQRISLAGVKSSSPSSPSPHDSPTPPGAGTGKKKAFVNESAARTLASASASARMERTAILSYVCRVGFNVVDVRTSLHLASKYVVCVICRMRSPHNRQDAPDSPPVSPLLIGYCSITVAFEGTGNTIHKHTHTHTRAHTHKDTQTCFMSISATCSFIIFMNIFFFLLWTLRISSTISCCELRSECVFPFVFFGFAAVSPSTQTHALVRHWLAQGTGDSCVHTCTQCTHPDAFEYMQDRNTHIDREIYTHHDAPFSLSVSPPFGNASLRSARFKIRSEV